MELKLNAILKEEAKSKITEVKRSTFYGGKQTGTETDLYIGKTRVTIRQGVVQSEIPTEGPISEEITGFIVGVRAEFTMCEDILGVTRAKGKYAHPDDPETTGTVEFCVRGTNSISCYGPTREKTLELFELIRDGNIRPSNEWDKAQIAGGKSREQLEVELTFNQEQLGKVWQENNRLHKTCNQLVAERDSAVAEMEHLRDELVSVRKQANGACEKNRAILQSFTELRSNLIDAWWPLCTKTTVAHRIAAILTSK